MPYKYRQAHHAYEHQHNNRHIQDWNLTWTRITPTSMSNKMSPFHPVMSQNQPTNPNTKLIPQFKTFPSSKILQTWTNSTNIKRPKETPSTLKGPPKTGTRSWKTEPRKLSNNNILQPHKQFILSTKRKKSFIKYKSAHK